jgi:hypothetical protein
LRLPFGGATGSNPYESLRELIRDWPSSSARREVLMITPGAGGFFLGTETLSNIFVDAAIRDAQRAGVVVHAVYALGAGHKGPTPWLDLWAQHYLAQIAEETGGEAYSLGFGAPISLTPYLSKFSGRLLRQYWVTFIVPREEPGFDSVRFVAETPGVRIVSARKFYVTAEGR